MSAAGKTGEAHASPKDALPFDVTLLVFLRDKGVFVLWVVLLIIFSIWNNPYFATIPNAMLILGAASLTAIFAAAIAVGLFAGALDLSLPGVAALAGCVTGLFLKEFGAPIYFAILAGMAVGPIVGWVNGRIVLTGLNPLVVTIGMLSITSGLAAIFVGGYAVSGIMELRFMGSARYFGVPSHVFIVAVVYGVLTVLLNYTRLGIRMRAVGGNAEAVRRAGLNSQKYQIYGFMFASTLAALGGIMTTAMVTQALPTANPSILFSALTAVFLAGVPLQGGRGSLPRVLIGALILATISNALTIAGVQPYWAVVTTGVLMIGALSFDKYLTDAISIRLVKISTSSVHESQVK